MPRPPVRCYECLQGCGTLPELALSFSSARYQAPRILLQPSGSLPFARVMSTGKCAPNQCKTYAKRSRPLAHRSSLTTHDDDLFMVITVFTRVIDAVFLPSKPTGPLSHEARRFRITTIDKKMSVIYGTAITPSRGSDFFFLCVCRAHFYAQSCSRICFFAKFYYAGREN